MLENNMLALTDHINSSVKVVDGYKKKVISCIKLPNNPWDIARVESDQIVATCVDKQFVFLKVGKTFSVVKVLDIDGQCRGIYCHLSEFKLRANP